MSNLTTLLREDRYRTARAVCIALCIGTCLVGASMLPGVNVDAIHYPRGLREASWAAFKNMGSLSGYAAWFLVASVIFLVAALVLSVVIVMTRRSIERDD